MPKIGIIGLGRAASEMLPAMVAHPKITISALAEPNEMLRNTFCDDFAVRGYADPAELCADSDVDVVYIATPHQFHCEHTVLAARFGKHILVEKPMALTLEECDEMITAARDAGVALMIGHTHGYDRPVRAMRDLTMSRRYGRLRMLNTANYSDFMY